MLNASRYFHTLRYLRPVQVYGRLWYKLYRPKPDLSPAPIRRLPSSVWCDSARKLPTLIGPSSFRFLNVEHDVFSAIDWNHRDWSKLWLYNLHYFEDLTAFDATKRIEWHRSLIMRWVAENPPGVGNGWESYPLSLRIVNWIKWALAGNKLPQTALNSLAMQVRFLAARMEFHLLGNHLLANAKALVFAGLFFRGREADTWIEQGCRILKRELPEQILDDGGHFERSPMYHSIILEDLLDLTNLFQCYCDASSSVALTDASKDTEMGIHADSIRPYSCLHGNNTISRRYEDRDHDVRDIIESLSVAEAAMRMIAWLKIMCHPDDEIALFNDAAFGIAPRCVSLYDYAERLGIHIADATINRQLLPTDSSIECLSSGHIKLTHLKTSGYVRVESGPMTAILDVAPIGPDYLPGHAHADTLTFELSLRHQRVIIDSGTSNYDESDERLQERSTCAHNTVVIDGQNSSEVWGSFRVARRARPFDLEINEISKGAVTVRCAHDGYRQLFGQPIHRREWHFQNNSLMIRDTITGQYHDAVGRFHFNSCASIKSNEKGNNFVILLPHDAKISCRILNGHGCLVSSAYHPEFGLAQQNQCLEVRFQNSTSLIVFDWM